MKYLSSHDLLGPEQKMAIGLITAEWALVEAAVSVAIWDYCNLDRDQGLSVTADLGSLAKLKMLRALALLRFENTDAKAAERVTKIINNLINLNSERNTIVHNLWWPDFVTDKIRTKKATTRSGELKEREITKNTDELMALYQNIAGAKCDLLDSQTDFGVTPPSRPKSQ